MMLLVAAFLIVLVLLVISFVILSAMAAIWEKSDEQNS
jgi:hypothetical protein